MIVDFKVLHTGMSFLVVIFGLLVSGFFPTDDPGPAAATSTQVVDDFEEDAPGKWPRKWRFLSSKAKSFEPLGKFMSEKEKFYVVEEQGNKFLRGYTEGEAQRISLPAANLDWNLNEYPSIRWRWRAQKLPAGAREDKVNDSGGAVYVSFAKTDWLGRPLSLKYTYSSTLPVGTVVSTGNVKIIVASSGAGGTGGWVNVHRNVLADYKKVFGGEAPSEPFTITLWSDSDDTKGVAEVDFDDIRLSR